MTMTVRELRETFDSLRREWPAFDQVTTMRELHIAAAINAGIVMLQVVGSGPKDFALEESKGDDPARAVALVTAARQKALIVARGNYRLVRRLIDQDDFADKTFRNEVALAAASLAQQGVEIDQMLTEAITK
jgi:hypothetical protein